MGSFMSIVALQLQLQDRLCFAVVLAAVMVRADTFLQHMPVVTCIHACAVRNIWAK